MLGDRSVNSGSSGDDSSGPRATAANGDGALLDAVQSEAVLDVAPVDDDRDESPEPELGGDEVERLAQVRGVHENARIGSGMLAILPVTAIEPGGEDEAHVSCGEVLLAAGERRGHLAGLCWR